MLHALQRNKVAKEVLHKAYRERAVSVHLSKGALFAGLSPAQNRQCVDFLKARRDLLEPFVFHQRRKVAHQKRKLFSLMLRVGERERRCSHGLRMIWILEEQGDCEVQFPDDVRVFVEQHVEAFAQRAVPVVRMIDRSQHVREFFR